MDALEDTSVLMKCERCGRRRLYSQLEFNSVRFNDIFKCVECGPHARMQRVPDGHRLP